MNNQDLSKPPKINFIKELRAIKDIALMPSYLLISKIANRSHPKRETPVLLIPGIGTDDRVMIPFKKYLENSGYDCFGWEMGTNLAGLDKRYDKSDLSWKIDSSRKNNGELGVAYLCDQMIKRTKTIYEKTKRPVALVGWSLGGSIAREVARDIPEYVECVVTLGSPVRGGPKYTSASVQMQKRGLDLEWIEQLGIERDRTPITRPVTAIVSKDDGIVGFGSTIDHITSEIEHVQTNISHLGMVFNKQAWDIALSALNRA